jgi:hypothetical protein
VILTGWPPGLLAAAAYPTPVCVGSTTSGDIALDPPGIILTVEEFYLD